MPLLPVFRKGRPSATPCPFAKRMKDLAEREVRGQGGTDSGFYPLSVEHGQVMSRKREKAGIRKEYASYGTGTIFAYR